LKEDHQITLEHVKIGDIAEVVGQLEAAKAVGKDSDGNVDLMWVNGENFAAMKNKELTWGAFANELPNASGLQSSKSITMDFSVPVEGLESPWGGAQLVFRTDAAKVGCSTSAVCKRWRPVRIPGASGISWHHHDQAVTKRTY